MTAPTLDQRIAQIVALDCLTPAERADMILAQPEIATGRALYAMQQEMRRRIKALHSWTAPILEESHHGRTAA